MTHNFNRSHKSSLHESSLGVRFLVSFSNSRHHLFLMASVQQLNYMRCASFTLHLSPQMPKRPQIWTHESLWDINQTHLQYSIPLGLPSLCLRPCLSYFLRLYCFYQILSLSFQPFLCVLFLSSLVFSQPV